MWVTTTSVERLASISPTSQGYLGRRPTVEHKTPARRSSKGKQPATRATTGAKEPRHVPRQNTPSSPSDAGSQRRNNASGSNSGGSRRGVVEVVVVATTMTTLIVHLPTCRVYLVVDEEDNGFSTMPKWSNN